ncbi:MAG TPA: FAD-binding and (Fe-S)-binding domain-containing protein [Pseudonocardiaceae bacterium]|nr:FAD-binding and (Fe-S)-binding domain-containing protein [Pseudonocardiaceae bacterium]
MTADLLPLLARAGVRDVDTGVRRRAEYSSDASNYRVVPTAVVFPRHVDDVLATIETCRATGVALTCRGAGTSIAGNAVGPGVVLDFSRHLNRVLSIDPDQRTATVEPGAVLDVVSAAAGRFGLRFGPDPSTHSRATIGGALANNACGARALRYGRSVDNVVDLDVATVDGTRFAATTLDAAPASLRDPLTALVRTKLAPIRQEFGRFARQGSGYLLDALLPEHGGDLARFLCGSEGTLAVTLGATVRLVTRPAATALAVLGYPDLPAAAEAVPALRGAGLVALEGMDSRLVDVLRKRGRTLPDLPAGGGWLFAELGGDTLAEAMDSATKFTATADCLDSVIVTGEAAAGLWRAREDGAGLGGRTPADQPAWPGWEDSAVPPERLAEYLREFRALLDRFSLDGLMYGHFGDGCVHSRIDFPLADRPAVFREFVGEAAELVAAFGGSMSGEHGDGRARSDLLRAMYSTEIIDTFAAVKHVFDPGALLNPGVVVDPAPVDTDLRLPLAKPLRSGLAFAYPADGGDLTTAVHRCVGVGRCRAPVPGTGVMCPSYLATKDEKDSTRGRARVLQEAVNGTLVGGLAADEVLDSLDLCLSCKGCSSDCPAGVDMATYKAEVLHQRYRGRLRPMAHYALGWLPRWSRLAAKVPALANAVLAAPGLATVAKRLAGVDARRGLPRFARQGFRAWFAEHRSPADGRRVLLWVDTFTAHFSPQVGAAAVRVLEAAGYRVALAGQACCGLTWISTGQLDGARRQLRRAYDALAPALADGLPVVVLEPSCATVFRSDAVDLLPGDPRAGQVAAAVRTLAELLSETEGWTPPRLDGVHGVAQPHCHHHAVLGWQTDQRLLADAGADITAVAGCCGLAGNFGVERGHYEVSAQVAETALLPAIRAIQSDGVVLADGFSCRTQLTELADRTGIHLAELLADRLNDGP